MQSLHSHLRKNDLLKFEAPPKLLKVITGGVEIRSGVLQNLP